MAFGPIAPPEITNAGIPSKAITSFALHKNSSLSVKFREHIL
jgi:hypothetical protein